MFLLDDYQLFPVSVVQTGFLTLLCPSKVARCRAAQRASPSVNGMKKQEHQQEHDRADLFRKHRKQEAEECRSAPKPRRVDDL